MKHRFVSILLGALTCLMLIAAGTGEVCAATLINNSADLGWTDSWNQVYAPVSDTAAILVLRLPVFIVAKDVRNIRSGETGTDIVTAMPDDMIEFSITITNDGETVARFITITDSVPAGTIYETGTASDTNNLDPIDPPDTITFQHIAGGVFDTNDADTVIAIKWQWDLIEGVTGDNDRTVKFRVRVTR